MLSLIKIFPLIHEIFPIIYYSRNGFFIEADNKTQERQNWDYFAMYQVPSFFIQNIDINHFLAVTRKNFKNQILNNLQNDQKDRIFTRIVFFMFCLGKRDIDF